jgi:hypothetical protein
MLDVYESRIRDRESVHVNVINKMTRSQVNQVLYTRNIPLHDVKDLIFDYAKVTSASNEQHNLTTISSKRHWLWRSMEYIVMLFVALWILLPMSIAIRFFEVTGMCFTSTCCCFTRQRNFQHLARDWFGNARSRYSALCLQYRAKYTSVSQYFVDHWCPSNAYFKSLNPDNDIDELSGVLTLVCCFTYLFGIIFVLAWIGFR